MNSAIIRNIRVSFRFPFLSACRSAHSTSTNAAETPETEELDKLYKTIHIEMRANDKMPMRSYSDFAKQAAEHLGITVGHCYAPPKPNFERDQLCLLRSGFANKNIRVQYEVRTYFRYMNFHHLTGSTADTFLEYIERNLPEGIALKITKVEVRRLPAEITVGKTSEETNTSSQTSSDSSDSSSDSSNSDAESRST